MASGYLVRSGRRNNPRVPDLEVGAERAGAPVLEFHLRLDVLGLLARVERGDQGSVLLVDVAAAHFPRAGELVVVRVELLVQDQEAAHLRGSKAAIARQLSVGLLDAALNQLVDLRFPREVRVARIGDTAPL